MPSPSIIKANAKQAKEKQKKDLFDFFIKGLDFVIFCLYNKGNNKRRNTENRQKTEKRHGPGLWSLDDVDFDAVTEAAEVGRMVHRIKLEIN